MLLRDRVAVIHGGGGAIGGAIARCFGREGARVHLTGRTPAKLEAVAADVVAGGGQASWAQLDLLDEAKVRAHAEELAARAGRIDVLVNAVGILHVQGTPFADLSLVDFMHPVEGYVRSHFIAAQAAARYMPRGGVMLSLSTPGARLAGSGFMGNAVASAAVEAISRALAGELGERGIRTVCLRPDAIPQALEGGSHAREVFRKAADAAGISVEAMLDGRAASAPLLRRLPTLDEVAEFAAFAASTRGGAMTGVIANLNCGSLVD